MAGASAGVERVEIAALPPDLLQVAERLLLDRRQPADDVALGRLAVGEIVDLVGLDHVVLVGLPHLEPLVADGLVDRPLARDVLGAGDLGGLAEHAGDALRDQLVVHVADGRAGGQARRGVALAALGRDPQVGDAAFLALQFARPLHHLLGLVGGLGDDRDVAVALDAEADAGLAGLLDAVDDARGPLVLDADHDARRDVGVRARADQRAEMQVEVGAELQPAVGVRDRQRALDVVGDRLARRVRQIVERQDQDVVPTPTRPFSRRQPWKERLDFDLPFFFVAMEVSLGLAALALPVLTGRGS